VGDHVVASRAEKRGRLPKDLRFSIVDINSFVVGNGLVGYVLVDLSVDRVFLELYSGELSGECGRGCFVREEREEVAGAVVFKKDKPLTRPH